VERSNPTEVIPYALWICLTGQHEALSAIVVTWVTQLSFSPHLIGMALESDSEFLRRVIANGEFTLVMLPREGGKDIAKRIMKAGALPRAAGYGDLFHTDAPWDGVPVGAMGAIRCSIRASTQAGDHTLIMGSVLDEHRWIAGEPLHLSDTGWRYTKPGADVPPTRTQD
jgi:flavin reductase (DIM6/NTAB) family NADH-FMN oxidoreductase RutF